MSAKRIHDGFNPQVNVLILAYERGKGGLRLIAKRETHNIMTTTGRAWLVQRLGASSYAPLTANTTEVVQYIGLGCGGALQTTATFANTQTELASVIALEDPVAYTGVAPALKTYLQTVKAQSNNTTYFPGVGRTVFIYDVPESYISFTGSTTFLGHVVNTEVPVSEAGLYLSGAEATYNSVGPVGVSPVTANRLACYNIFDPIIVTPSVMLRVLWEIRVAS